MTSAVTDMWRLVKEPLSPVLRIISNNIFTKLYVMHCSSRNIMFYVFYNVSVGHFWNMLMYDTLLYTD